VTIDIHDNWKSLKYLAKVHCAQYLPVLIGLEADITVHGNPIKHYLGFKRAPAAKRNHHPYEGGLVQHLLEMWEFWCSIRTGHQLFLSYQSGAILSDTRVLTGILNHDLHKAYLYYELMDTIPVGGWLVERRTHLSCALLTDNAKTIDILMRFRIALDETDLNCLIYSEGGWAKDPPVECTPLAKLVYLLDEFSGNVRARIDEGTIYRHITRPKEESK